MISKCCKAELKVANDPEGTSWYYCSECGDASDPAIEKFKGKHKRQAFILGFTEGKKAGYDEGWHDGYASGLEKPLFAIAKLPPRKKKI